MRKVHWLFLLRSAALVGLFSSSILALDYSSLEPRFCGYESGCGAVRASGLGYLPLPGLGLVPLPILGLLAFLVLFGMSLGLRPREQSRFVPPLAYALSVVGVVLLLVQAFLIGAFCVYCVLTDFSCIAIGYAAYALRGLGFDEALEQSRTRTSLVDSSEMFSSANHVAGVWQDDSRLYEAPTPLVRPAPRAPLRLRSLGWAALAVIALLAPPLFGRFAAGPSVPPSVAELYVQGKINVVEFFDFECPHCRGLAPRLEAVLREKKNVRFVRQYVPLPGHERAKPAAIASICAAEQGKEEVVASELLANDDLSDEGIRGVLAKAGLDLEKIDACAKSERPEKRLRADLERLEKAEFLGLPTTYIGGTRVLGAQPLAVYRDALERAESGEDKSGIQPPVYWALVALLAGIVVLLGRVRVGSPIRDS